jgi:hypothetical protein
MSIDDATPEEWDAVAKELKTVSISSKDPVNSPTHYTTGDIECIEAIKSMLTPDEYIGYLRGNSLKYRWRFRYKNGLEDLKKAEWYERRLSRFISK